MLALMTRARHDDRLPELDVAQFAEFQEKWRAAEIADYQITIEVSGRQAAVYSVDVRNGQVVTATRDGLPLRQRRTFSTWSVPGMFTTIQSDVDNLIKHREGSADRLTPQLLLRAKFHPQLGYPEKYHRTELQKWRSNSEVYWRVKSFVTADGPPP